MEQKDYASLLPVQPPEGFLDWLRGAGELDEGLLIYKGAWAKNPKTGKKERKVQLLCTHCGELSYADKNEVEGCVRYEGFVHPTTGDVVTSGFGCGCHCPVCGNPVRAKHQGEIHGTYSINACFAMSIHHIEGLLVLCGWNVQKHFDKNGDTFETIHPYEAYVVEKKKLVRLNGWKGGQLHKRLTNHWEQRKQFRDNWGETRLIYPWDKSLLEGTTVENSKLDLYLESAEVEEESSFPVAYLRLWLKRPNVENLVVQGAGYLVNQILEEEESHNGFGRRTSTFGYECINWKEKRPSQMLGLEKQEFQTLLREGWSNKDLKFVQLLKESGYIYDSKSLASCDEMGYWNCMEVVKSEDLDLMKVAKYLCRQKKKDKRNNYSILKDYWRMARNLEMDLTNPDIAYPSRLYPAHERVVEELKREKIREHEEKIRIQYEKLSVFSWEKDGIFIRPVMSVEDLEKESEVLHHCVRAYAKSIAEGETTIFFIRRDETPDEPWYTLEFDLIHLEVKQNCGKYNEDPTEEVKETALRRLLSLNGIVLNN